MINKYQQFSAITVQYQQTSQVIGKNGIFSTFLEPLLIV